MPEGPEASFLCNFISENFEGNKLLSINILRGRYVKHGAPPNYKEFTSSLPLKLKRVDKKGKVIFLYFEDNWCIISKLGMTGWWYTDDYKPTWKSMQPNIMLNFSENSQLVFSDFRNFGTITITQDNDKIKLEYDKLASDIMSTDYTYKQMIHSINLYPKRSNHLIEDALTDQQFFVSGIGNYLKAEILYQAKISPLRTISSLSLDEWKELYKIAKKTTKLMYRILLSRDDDKYMNTMKIYGKKEDKYGNKVISHTTKKGRTTFWVPSLQK
jgi:DNA-formamidopyrimidine glycosylase